MNILIACEFSGVVREAFRARGHNAWSCDLRPAEDNSLHHIKGDALETIARGCEVSPGVFVPWDLVIAHPPCTHLAVSGARWFPAKQADGSQQQAIDFFLALANAPIPKICIENPICIMSRLYRKPDQIIQPWQFGHGETKATCLWLKGLPKLTPTNIVEGREQRIWKMPPGPNRERERSRTFQGIADAMASQWG